MCAEWMQKKRRMCSKYKYFWFDSENQKKIFDYWTYGLVAGAIVITMLLLSHSHSDSHFQGSRRAQYSVIRLEIIYHHSRSHSLYFPCRSPAFRFSINLRTAFTSIVITITCSKNNWMTQSETICIWLSHNANWNQNKTRNKKKHRTIIKW